MTANNWKPGGVTMTTTQQFAVGQRVRLIRPFERYPHCMIWEGATGTVTIAESAPEFSEVYLAVRWDHHEPGLAEWDNEGHWDGECVDMGDDPADCLEVIE